MQTETPSAQNTIRLARFIGGGGVIGGLVAGLIVWFVLPASSGMVSSLALLLAFVLFWVGMGVLFFGQVKALTEKSKLKTKS